MSRRFVLAHIFANVISLWMMVTPSQLIAQTGGCFATPQAAAQGIIGAASGVATQAAGAGFRVQDVQIDPVMRRVWVRVRRCDNAAAPAVLVPIQTTLQATVSQPAATSSVASSASAGNALAVNDVVPTPASFFAPPTAPLPLLIHAGLPVHVIFASTAVRMELDGTANANGAVGQTVEVTLNRRPDTPADEPAHRMRGTVRADGIVEVQQ